MHEGEVLPAVMSVAEVSAKEFGIEKMLDKMLGLWQVIMPAQHLDCVDYASSACRSALLQPMEYGVLEYRDTGTYIIRGTDEINTLLDDHIVATQAMSFSPYKKVRAIIVVPLYMEHPYWSCYYSSSPRSRRQGRAVLLPRRAAAPKVKFTGLAQNLGQLQAFNRDRFQSNRSANLNIESDPL